jgi:tRNA(adenine34) deaminase
MAGKRGTMTRRDDHAAEARRHDFRTELANTGGTGSFVVVNNAEHADQEQVFVVLSVARIADEATHDASAHTKLLALRAAAVHQQSPNRRLNVNQQQHQTLQHTQYTTSSTATTTTALYSTLEPCPMCLTAAHSFRVDRIVYGANDDRLGAVTTHMRLLQDYQHPFHNITKVTAGVESQASSEMLREFLRQRRLEHKQNEQPRKQHEKEQQHQVEAE